MSQPKRIVICGGSAAGATVAIQLQKQFTANDIHITIVDKLEKRFNIFATPRGFVQPDFANKQFVGWDKFFSKPGIGEFVHGRVAAVHASEIELENGTKLPFDFLVFATGSSYLSILPNSANSSSDVLAILHKVADGIKSASKVVIVGAGAVGIEVAAEIRSQYPDKKVTLIHSQLKLAVGATSKSFHDRTLAAIKKLGIDLVLGDPVTSANYPSGFAIGPNTVTTKSGAVFDSDLTIFSTGFGTPNSEAIKSLQVDKPLLDDRGYVLVKSTLQLEDSRFPNILSLGNVAATGAVPTAIAAKAQAAIVAKNVIAMIKGKPLKEYKPDPQNIIIVTLGPKAATGEIPGMFGFLSDFIGRTVKSGSLFNDQVYGEMHVPYK